MFINIGIDLGTTNSGIGVYRNGKVEILKNPVGFKDTLPSVVAFRKNRTVVGEKALELLKVTPENVYASFKRKMGTDSIYISEVVEGNITPVFLSSLILRELLSFNINSEMKSAVITIPASFDTIQSNATKEAGYEAGLKEVVLLQEPIAACLAYSNELNLKIDNEELWLVYDFGGGTFDAALVKINETELKVVDHEGNNFLGGVDIDYAIIEKLFIPIVERELNESDLFSKLRNNQSVFYKKLNAELLFKAEQIKKELSISEESFFEIDIIERDIYIEEKITRNQIDQIIDSFFNQSFELLEKLVNTNQIQFSDITKIILVGGTTYIPYIRKQLKEKTKINVDSSIDPTTAVIVGAAYYAGTKKSNLTEEENHKGESLAKDNVSTLKELEIQWQYETTSRDKEELITCTFNKEVEGFFRIIRNDGGFDTGLMKFSNKILEFVPLIEKSVNDFHIKIFDKNQNLIDEKKDIQIACGLFNVVGQPLPNDISIEVDDKDGKTILEKIFKKNEILPLKKTIYKTISKNILKNSDDKLIINIVEGDSNNLPASNSNIGYIEISGETFVNDLIRGTDIEIEFEISESRDLSINLYISSIDLELQENFNPHKKTVSIEKLKLEVKHFIEETDLELDYNDDEDFEYLAKIKKINTDLKEIYNDLKHIDLNEKSDQKFQLEDRKRKSIQQYDDLKRISSIMSELEEFEYLINNLEKEIELMSPREKIQFKKIKSQMSSHDNKTNKYLLRLNNEKLQNLEYEIRSKKIDFYIEIFFMLIVKDKNEFNEYHKVEKLIPLGRSAIDKNNFVELKSIVNQIYYLYKDKGDDNITNHNMTIGLK